MGPEALRGKWVVPYFHPKDITPGCTLGAVTFSATFEEFTAPGTRVIGVSGDSPEIYQRFAEKYNLTVALLSDTNPHGLKEYDVWKPKGPVRKRITREQKRDTFLISPCGTIVEVRHKVKVKGHAEAVRTSLMSRG